MKKLLLLASFGSHLAMASTLDVHVYNWAGTPPSILNEAETMLSRILRGSGIRLRWQLKSLSNPEATLVVLPEASSRGEHPETECSARRDVALKILRDAIAPTPRSLGYANPLAPAGINATVLYDRIAALARDYAIPVPTLLAHAIAHEIGHVLLRSDRHTTYYGLMGADWDRMQLEAIGKFGMLFDSTDSKRMRATLAGHGCAGSQNSRRSAN